MQSFKRFCWGAALVCLSMGAPASASTIYTFSYSNVEGDIAGTVSGTITLPDGDGAFAATSIVVTSSPAALGYPLPFDVFINLPDIVQNAFTVSGGSVVSAVFGAQNLANDAFTFNLPGGGTIFNVRGSGSLASAVWDVNSSTLTFGGRSSVPEPSTITLLFGAVLAGMTRRRRNLASSGL